MFKKVKEIFFFSWKFSEPETEREAFPKAPLMRKLPEFIKRLVRP
jgi:hypothetical protein